MYLFVCACVCVRARACVYPCCWNITDLLINIRFLVEGQAISICLSWIGNPSFSPLSYHIYPDSIDHVGVFARTSLVSPTGSFWLAVAVPEVLADMFIGRCGRLVRAPYLRVPVATTEYHNATKKLNNGGDTLYEFVSVHLRVTVT